MLLACMYFQSRSPLTVPATGEPINGPQFKHTNTYHHVIPLWLQQWTHQIFKHSTVHEASLRHLHLCYDRSPCKFDLYTCHLKWHSNIGPYFEMFPTRPPTALICQMNSLPPSMCILPPSIVSHLLRISDVYSKKCRKAIYPLFKMAR